MKSFDIIIVGGGVVGLTLAGMLAQNGFSVALIDQQAAPLLNASLPIPYDVRVSAINHASQRIFASLGVWSTITQQRVSAYHAMHVWDINSPASIDFDSTQISQAHLGYIVEQTVLRRAVWQSLQQHEGVHLFPVCHPILLQAHTDSIRLTLNDQSELTATVLIGADGRDSWVAHQTGLATEVQAANEVAIVATLRSERVHRATAWQRFLATGPVALLPLADNHLVSLVWSTTTAQAAQLMALDDIIFNQRLSDATEHILGKLVLTGQRLSLPLQRHHSQHYVKSRIALIGDAAHSILPLAGQGLNLGLMDAACLAEVLQQAMQAKRDIGDSATLRRYERWRKGENALMMAMTEGLYRVFSYAPLGPLRYAGFAMTGKLPWVKSIFMQRAAGLSGDLPKRIKDNG